MKWAVVAGVALLVLIVARRVQAAAADPRNPANYDYMPGYAPGSGYMT